MIKTLKFSQVCGYAASMIALGALPAAAQSPAFSLMHTFSAVDVNGANSDGQFPGYHFVQAFDGNYYGITNSGGLGTGAGTIWKMTPAGVLTALHYFSTATDGGEPYGLTLGQDGNLYGCCMVAGAHGSGTIWKVTLAGVFTTLHSFDASALDISGSYFSNTEGSSPGPLCQGADGNFYGATAQCGPWGAGTLFEITPAGVFTILRSFGPFNQTNWTNSDGSGSCMPVQAQDGWIYGMTRAGGSNGKGTLYKFNPASPSSTFTTIHSFQAGSGGVNTDGAGIGKLLLGSGGALYGITRGGGSNGKGTFFSMTTAGAVTTLANFGAATGAVGKTPTDLFYGTDGYFYGTTEGVGTANAQAFKISSAGAYTPLYTFVSTYGDLPQSIAAGSDGYLYGLTGYGGVNQNGTIFRLATALPKTPAISTFTPTSTTAGHATFTITLTGQNFLPSSRVYFNTTPLSTVYYTPTTITATVPASLVTTHGTINMTVVSPAPAGSTAASVFTVI